MITLREAKVREVQRLLMKWTDPKPEVNGLMARSLAERMVDELEACEAIHAERVHEMSLETQVGEVYGD